MRIATFNINGLTRRLGNLADWLDATKPDVVCLQELKTAHDRFPAEALAEAGYGAVWRGEKTWNGVAILARDATPVMTRDALPGEPGDAPARYVEAAVSGVLIGCLYAPNGNPAPGPKFEAKLAWHERFAAHAADLLAAGVPVVLAGDYNVVPEARDIYPTRSYDGNALISPEARAAYARLLAQGWTDALRKVRPEGSVYTFWDYRRNRFERDGGMRLDHLLLSPELAPRLRDAGVDRDVRGRENASDHAPVWITLGPGRRRR
ncbi:MAG: exodeoxyribonuclease III [Rhodovulum sulfidophilum]|uniref:Exodeoxyribonuclease III n=1 Tax=Rhodovulum sulfidophilum TaxID=35806 RepID=A0A2W5PZE0_RHOSU|nr:MAG: exodeoxyribonuclease III [Rhodovulum sulfidophilum]